MFTQLREEEGASYSPNVDSSWPTGLAAASFIVTSQLKPEGFERFFAISRGIAADLLRVLFRRTSWLASSIRFTNRSIVPQAAIPSGLVS